nr:immunoglobulin light chain junction region [Macaca mulatta]MPO11842.1 immunoglobulin light chain junction region [Macaca mulatta]
CAAWEDSLSGYIF